MGGCVRVLCAVVFAVVFSCVSVAVFPVVGNILLLCVCALLGVFHAAAGAHICERKV